LVLAVCGDTGHGAGEGAVHRQRVGDPRGSLELAAGRVDRAEHVVGHGDAGDGDVALVADDVGPGHGVADGHVRAGGVVGVLAVGGLLDVDARFDAEVVGRVVVGDRAAG